MISVGFKSSLYLSYLIRSGIRQFTLYLLLIMSGLSGLLYSQTTHRSEAWLGYITSYRLNEKWGIWNDFHYVGQTFFVSRHGLTYFAQRNLEISGGYAYVATSLPGGTTIERPENRIWGQVETRITFNRRWIIRARCRHDARFRQAIDQGQLLNEKVLSMRYRFLVGLRYKVIRFDSGRSIHANVLNEFLLHSGSAIQTGVIDQNRTYLLAGFTLKRMTLMVGYHNRLLPNIQTGNLSVRHGLTLWGVQSFGWKADKVFIPLD